MDRKKILVTAPLADIHAGKLAEHHDVGVIPFIAIEPVESEELKAQIALLCENEQFVVFTSNNGVRSVAAMIGKKPEKWKIFSIEGVTSKSLEEHFGAGSLAGTALYGEDLAKAILSNDDVKEVIFFCGDLRRDELPERLRAAGVKVTEVIVYETVATPSRVERQYDAILFFSPSAVYSYVALNTIPEQTVCFAIGNTTANTIKNVVNNRVLIADPPLKERVVEMVLEYYR